MNRVRAILAALLGLASILVMCGAARAQDVAVRAQVESQEVYVGEPFVFQIVVEGRARPAPITFPDLPWATVEDLGTSEGSNTSVTIINGRRTQSETISSRTSWTLTPMSEGVFEIPGVPVEVDGRIYVTQAIEVRTKEPQETDEVKLRIDSPRSSPFVGEAVRVRLTLYVQREARNLRLTIPERDGALEFAPIPPSNIDNTDLRTGRAHQLTVNGRTAIGLVDEAALDGQMYTTLTIDLLMTARRAGAVELGPATVAMDLVVGRRRPTSLIDDMMMLDRSVTSRFVAPSNVLGLDVRALPAEGRPDGYEGIVGSYKVEATAHPTTVNVGDPITLTMIVRGPEPIEDAPTPDLEENAEFTGAFKLATGGPPVRIENGAKIIERTIRATDPDVEWAPPVGFWTFDPIAEKYVRVESKPIALDVAPTTQVTLADADGFDDEEPPARLESRRSGLAANRVGERALASQGFDLAVAWRAPASLVALGAPAALGLGALLTSVVRRRAASAGDARASRGALRRALASLRAMNDSGQGSGAQEVSRAVRTYLAERLHRPAGGLTAADGVGLLRAASCAEAESVGELLRRCDLARFGGDGAEATRLRDEATALLQRVDASLGRHRAGAGRRA